MTISHMCLSVHVDTNKFTFFEPTLIYISEALLQHFFSHFLTFELYVIAVSYDFFERRNYLKKMSRRLVDQFLLGI